MAFLLVEFARPFQVRDGEINIQSWLSSFRLTVTAPRIRAWRGHAQRTLAKQSRISSARCAAPFPGSRNRLALSGLAVAVYIVICVLATSRRSIGARSGAL